MAGAVVSRGGTASVSSSPTVHCQTGPAGEPQCYTYRSLGPLRAGDPEPIGASPYASVGESANGTATPINATPRPANMASVTTGGSGAVWTSPMPLGPEPLPVPLAIPMR